MTRPADHAAARREFIRDHHPDRGGDLATFIEGLQAIDDLGRLDRPARVHPGFGEVTVFRTRKWNIARWVRRVRRRRARDRVDRGA